MVALDSSGKPIHSRQVLDLGKASQPYRIRRTLEQSKLAFDPRRLFD
jgi:hypothetical protein